jgi:enoyl-CoA hydratase/carnithine racemase
MPGGAIRWQLDGGIARLFLTRAEKRNALRLADWAEFAEALDRIAASGAKAVIVGSDSAGVFSAGSDLGELAGLAREADQRTAFARAMDGVMTRLANGPLVSIAAISGACHGAGVAIAMACNIRVTDAGSAFAIPPARFGISYPIGDIRRLERLVGPGQAARLLYAAEQIDAAEALRIGLVELLVPDAVARAEALAGQIAANAADSLVLLKRALAFETGDPARDAQFIEGFASADFRRFVER